MTTGRGFVALMAAAWLVAGCGAEGRGGRQSLEAGEQALKRRELRQALAHFRRAVEQAPSSAEAHTERGNAAELLGEFDEAMEAYDAAARLARSAASLFRVGALADRMGNPNLAVEWLKASLASQPPSRSDALVELLERFVRGLHASREDVAERLFQVYLESGDRAGALDLARAEGWIREEADYCEEPLAWVSDETQALLAMLIHPQEADCVLSLGMSLTTGGAVRLARLALGNLIEHSQDPGARERASTFLRARLPAHDVAKLAEALNAVGYNLHYVYKNPDEALATFRKAIAADPTFSWPYSNTGNVLAHMGQRDQALEWYRKAIAINPNHWRAQLNLGKTFMELRRYDEALVPLRQAVALLPDDWESRSDLGRTLMSLDHDQEGAREVQTAVRLNHENRKDRVLLDWWVGMDPRLSANPYSGWHPEEAFPAGTDAGALEGARQGVAAAPSSIGALLALGGIAEFLGEFDEARGAYAKAAAVSRSDQKVLYRSASLALRIGEFDRALALLDGVSTSNPWWAPWLERYVPDPVRDLLLGREPGLESLIQLKIDILMERGDLAGARNLAREARIVQPDRNYCGEAREQMASGPTDAISSALRLAALAHPNAAECVLWFGQLVADEGFVGLGRLLVMEGMRVASDPGHKASGQDYLRIRLSDGREVPKRAEQLSLFGYHRYMRDGDVQGAVRLLEAALRLDPRFPRPYHHLARIAWDQGDRPAAIAWLERALEADPNSWRTFRNLGKALEGLGRYAEAERYLRKALESFGHDVGGRLALARVLYAQGRFDEYADHTQWAVEFSRGKWWVLPGVEHFLATYRKAGPGRALPPAPDPRVIIGWKHD